MAFTLVDPSGYAITEGDLDIIRPKYEEWKLNNQGSLQHYISNVYFSVQADQNDDEDSFDIENGLIASSNIDWDKAPTIRSKFSSSQNSIFKDLPVIGGKMEDEDSYENLDTFGKSNFIESAKKVNVKSSFSQRPQFNSKGTSKSTYNDDDSYENLPTFGQSNQKKVSFVGSRNVTPQKKTYDQTQQMRAIGHLIPYMIKSCKNPSGCAQCKKSGNCLIDEMIHDKERFHDFKNQIQETVAQLSTPKNQKLNMHPFSHDMVDIDKIAQIKANGGQNLAYAKQAGIIFSTFDHQTFVKRSAK